MKRDVYDNKSEKKKEFLKIVLCTRLLYSGNGFCRFRSQLDLQSWLFVELLSVLIPMIPNCQAHSLLRFCLQLYNGQDRIGLVYNRHGSPPIAHFVGNVFA